MASAQTASTMHHNISLITTIAAAPGFGLFFGMLALRLRLPALMGYLAAGIVIGPTTPSSVADLARTLLGLYLDENEKLPTRINLDWSSS